MSTTYATGINGNPIAASEVKPSSSLGTKLDGKASTSHTHSVIINGSTKEIAATGGSAVNRGTYLTPHQTIKQDGVTGSTSHRFGTCSTAAGTAGKEVSITSGTFSLEAGARVAVMFSNANTADSPTLKVGSTAAKNIFVNGSRITTGSNKGLLKGTVIFIYDGTQYNLIGNYYDSTYSGFVCANCSTAAGTAAKVASATNYTAKEGNVILVNFANTNSAAGALTLKVGGVTAPIRWNGTLTASGTTSAIPAGTWPCTYDGANWNIYTDGSYLYKRVYAADLITANTISVGSTTPSYVELRQKLKDGVSTFYAVTLVAANAYVLFMPMLLNTYSTELDYGSIGFGTVHNGIYYYVTYSSGNVWSSIQTANLLSDTSISAGTDLTVSTSGGTVTIAVDTNGTASGTKAFVEGNSTTASANYAHAEGNGTTASQEAAHAEGTATTASGYNAHAEGQSSAASGDNAHAEGYNTSASRPSSHSEGTNSRAENKQAHAEGFAALAYGESSHAEGSCCVTGGVSAHAEGGATYAGGKDAHAEGFSNGYVTAELAAPMSAGSGTFTFASGTSLGGHNYIAVPSIGFFSKIIAAAGPTYTTQGSVSVALPAGTLCMFVSSGAVGYVSHSEGFKTLALERSTHAEGDCTQALGAYSHAEGSGTKASGAYSHAEGCGTTAGGNYSHAEGQDTVTSGAYAHAEGLGTVAQSDYMHVAGMYNYSKSGYARVTGWGTGTADTDRKDIERLDTSGNLWLSGYLAGATVFMIVPGTTTRAQVEAAYQANRPMMIDISGFSGTQNVYVPTEVRRVFADNSGTEFDYYFKFTYPYTYNAGYKAGVQEPNGTIACYYIAVTKDNGWVKMTDVSHNTWSLWNSSTSFDIIPYAEALTASSADYASDCYTNSTLDTRIKGKLETDGSNVATTWTDSNINKILKNISAGSDDVWDGDDIIASSHSNNAKSQEFTRRTTAHLKKCIYNGGTLTGQFTSTAKVDNPICIEHSSSGKDAYFHSKVGSVGCGFGVGSGGTNHGIWSDVLNAWMISEQGDGRVHLNGNSILISKTAQLAPGASSIDTIEICKALGSAGGPGYLACGAIRITGTRGYGGSTNYCSVINKSNNFTVSMSDMANPQEGQIYFYYNTSSSELTVTWKRSNSYSASGTVYVGCIAQFMLVDKDNQVFARIF